MPGGGGSEYARRSGGSAYGRRRGSALHNRSGGSAYARRSGRGSAYARPYRSAARDDDGGRGGLNTDTPVTGFLGNLAGDVARTITGLPGGIKEAVTNPVKTAKAVGRSYADMYGPLPRGDVDEFAKNLYEHRSARSSTWPPSPRAGRLLATIGGLLAEPAARTVELRSPRTLATGEGPVVAGRALSRNPVIRARQLGIHRLLKSLPPSTPIVGELARYGRAVDRIPRQKALQLQLASRRFARSFERLDDAERAAWHLRGRRRVSTWFTGHSPPVPLALTFCEKRGPGVPGPLSSLSLLFS
jgi:hypothetical protein